MSDYEKIRHENRLKRIEEDISTLRFVVVAIFFMLTVVSFLL